MSANSAGAKAKPSHRFFFSCMVFPFSRLLEWFVCLFISPFKQATLIPATRSLGVIAFKWLPGGVFKS